MMLQNSYDVFLKKKVHEGAVHGFDPVFMPDFLFDFQKYLVEWAVITGRDAVLSDCGTGKTAMFFCWAQNVVQKTNKPVLILTPLAVAGQTIREAAKFNIEAARSNDGGISGAKIYVTNYEKLHHFDWKDFGGIVCDESSCIKDSKAERRKDITTFMRKIPYRFLGTATAAPNDYFELGTSSEALGYLGFMDMLNRFFVNDQNNSAMRRMYGEAQKFRFRGHAEVPFWRWVCSWARAMRRPSDLGFSDEGFILPDLKINEHVVSARKLAPGMLFSLPARNLPEQREEKKRTINERCEKVAALVDTDKPAFVGCHLNAEGDLLEKIIPGAVQVSGSDSDQAKEEKMMAFIDGQARVLVTKPKIGAWGLNFQHCSHICYFPSHSYEQWYQWVRRCWRFGQKNEVTVDIVLTEGERKIMDNLQRKSAAADKMFENLVNYMRQSQKIETINRHTKKMEAPSWLM